MSSIISEARKSVHTSRSKIITLTEWYEQKLRAWYQANEDLKAQHEAATTKLKEDNHALNRQLEIARVALKNAEDRAKIAEKKLFNLKEKSLALRIQ